MRLILLIRLWFKRPKGPRQSGSVKSMAIRKQEFYEGAALHILVRASGPLTIRYEAPFFSFNNQLAVLIKYSTRSRSPWGFTFGAEEQVILERRATAAKTAIALICGADGVAALTYDEYASVAGLKNFAIHVGCSREHGEYYDITGPDRRLGRKIAPSNWGRIIETSGVRA
jgi:hypothetical protein